MTWKKIWWFLWKDDSFASLLVNILLAIVLIKYILYPGLGLILGTSFPVVAVVSCSMQHDPTNCWADCYLRGEGSLNSCLNKNENLCGRNANELKGDYWNTCGEWYEGRKISEEEFSTFQQSNGFNIGDIFILKKADDIKIGDVIVYNNKYSNAPIIHRVVGIEDGYYMTKGDHNADASFFERKIGKEQVYGKVLLKIPYLGLVKVLFNVLLKGVGVI
ncbi:signal peptidase I [Candidatus Woesearchaeota archaeon]|nr:signal peptidase I [Candidatus Woesearchaeota archaeon]